MHIVMDYIEITMGKRIECRFNNVYAIRYRSVSEKYPGDQEECKGKEPGQPGV